MSYGPDFPEPLRLYTVTVGRDLLEVAEYEEAALLFLAEVEAEYLAVAEMAGIEPGEQS